MDLNEMDFGSDFEEEDFGDQLPTSPRNPEKDVITQRLYRVEDSPLSLIPEPIMKEIPKASNFPLKPLDALPGQYRHLLGDIKEFNYTQSVIFDTVFGSENSIAVCAPTGSGKTVIFELAIIKAIHDHEKLNKNKAFTQKIIYLAPLKALCGEKSKIWIERFSPKLKVLELTGDSESEDMGKMRQANLIIATPEKWDSVTRKWTSTNKLVMEQTILICIDEVHMLAEEPRGASLEALVSRVKTSAEIWEKRCRFIVASATAPNIRDLGKWLGYPNLPGVCFKLGDDSRSCKLEIHVWSVHFSTDNVFSFDSYLTKVVPDVVKQFSSQKPTLVFCMTRKSTESTAKHFALCWKNNSRTVETQQQLNLLVLKINDKSLQQTFAKGAAFHHAGLSANDRRIVEDAFRSNQLDFVACTSTLAMGMNLPAHLVIIKGTHKFGDAGTTELTETELTQMAGRAGRPQYDTKGVAVILCAEKDEAKYSAMAKGEKVIESHLHKNIFAHLNAEIVLQTIGDVTHALRWLKSTFFYIRCLQNKPYYSFADCNTGEKVEARLKNILVSELNGLMKATLITMERDGTNIRATEAGKLMASYYIDFETMKSFVEVGPKKTLKDLLMLICSSKEMAQEITLRNEDKKILYPLNSNKSKTEKIRYANDEKIKTSEMKAFILIQTEFGCIEFTDPQFARYRSEITRIRRLGVRLTKCFCEYMCLESVRKEKGFQSVRYAILLAKVFRQGLWENSAHVTKQLAGIGLKYSTTFVSHGLTNFESITKKLPQEITGMCGRKGTFGLNVIKASKGVPIYHLEPKQLTFDTDEILIQMTVSMTNHEEIAKRINSTTGGRDDLPAGRYHSCILLVGNSNDEIVFFRKVRDIDLVNLLGKQKFTFSLKKTEDGADRVYVSYLSETFVGVDITRTTYTVDFIKLEEDEEEANGVKSHYDFDPSEFSVSAKKLKTETKYY